MNFGYVAIPAVEFDEGEEGRNVGLNSEIEDNFSSDKNNDSFFNEKTTSVIDGEISSESGVNETIVKNLKKAADMEKDEILENKIAEMKAEEFIDLFSENESNIQNVKRGANKYERPTFTRSQLDILETEFLKTPFPDMKKRVLIALITGLPEKWIETWFKNQRAKLRRENWARQDEIVENKAEFNNFN
uniref:Homeobox domain-containing protein n=1 Tax=Panagrolaimus davidi TaxID=227884 RepID=A0A914PJI6_9BILA